MNAIILRHARSDDYDALGKLMFEAIHDGPTRYTKAQSLAWLDKPRSGPDWAARLDEKQVILAESDGTAIGFMTIEPGGYIDFAYIHPSAQGSGLFRRLFEQVEAIAREAGENHLSTHASLMAQPAFAAMGFETDFHETVDANGQKLDRAHMTKAL